VFDGKGFAQNDNGGALRVEADSLDLDARILDDTTIRNFNTAGSGGAVYVSDGTSATISNGSVIENCSAQTGGAVYMGDSAMLTVKDGAKVTGCSAQMGGAIYGAHDYYGAEAESMEDGDAGEDGAETGATGPESTEPGTTGSGNTGADATDSEAPQGRYLTSTLYMNGAEITGNTTNQSNRAAVEAGEMQFVGNVKVIDNKDMTVNYNNETYFTVKVVSEDEKVNAINAPVTFTINGKTTTTTTDEDGIAKIKITENPGTYTIKTTFNNQTYTNTITVTTNDNNTPDKKHKHDNTPNQHNSKPTYTKQATHNTQPTYYKRFSFD
jgi:hypothetical protein